MHSPRLDRPSPLRRGFTLIELLVVVGIIGLLLGILMPSLSRARHQAKAVMCRASLRDLGGAFQMYLNDSKNKLPRVNTMPSVQPPISNAPSIVELFQPYVLTTNGVYRCPDDRIVADAAGAPPGFQTYFEREGSSFQYNPILATLYAGRQIQHTPLYQMGRHEIQPIMSDYEPFHGRKGDYGAMHHLFADMHVDDYR